MGEKTNEVVQERTKVLVLMVEGETEEEFYRAVIDKVHTSLGKSFSCKIVIKTLHGVGKFKNKAVNIFKNKIQSDFENAEFTILLCIDTDVFELSSKPPFDPPELKQTLLDEGAEKVEFIKAKSCIEDWFLLDSDGIKKMLRIPKSTKITGETGVKKLEKLFQKGNRMYIKGKKCEGLIKALDIEKIMKAKSKELNPLYNELKGN